MQTNQVKATLKAGKTVAGPILGEVRSIGSLKLLMLGGYDFVFIDMEHAVYDFETVGSLVQYALAIGLCPIVRASDLTYGYIARAMDAGAQGVIVPRIETAEQAAEVVSYAKYPPLGRRGAGGDGRNGYDKLTAAAAVESSNAEGLVVVQIESQLGVDNVEAIAATEGVDVLLIGPQDLSISLGVPGNFTDPIFLAAAQKVADACAANGKASGMVEKSAADFRRWHDMGMRFLCCNSDGNMLLTSAQRDVAVLNEFVER